MAALEETLAAAGGRPFALVSHGCLITLVLRELDPAIGFGDWARMTTPDVYRVTGSGLGLACKPCLGRVLEKLRLGT